MGENKAVTLKPEEKKIRNKIVEKIINNEKIDLEKILKDILEGGDNE